MISIRTRLVSSITMLTIILATILRVFSRLRKFLSRGLIRYQSNDPSVHSPITCQAPSWQHQSQLISSSAIAPSSPAFTSTHSHHHEARYRVLSSCIHECCRSRVSFRLASHEQPRTRGRDRHQQPIIWYHGWAWASIAMVRPRNSCRMASVSSNEAIWRHRIYCIFFYHLSWFFY